MRYFVVVIVKYLILISISAHSILSTETELETELFAARFHSLNYANRQNRTYQLRWKRIVQGWYAKYGSVPYHVTVFGITATNATTCGGSLISHNFIVTAAHCIYEAKSILLVFNGPYGGSDVDATNFNHSAPLTIACDTNSVIVHADFNVSNQVYDIGLVRLPRPVNFTAYIQPVRLPGRQNVRRTYDDESGQICGIGMTVSPLYGPSPHSNFLLCANVTVNRMTCWRLYLRLADSLLCIRGDGVGQGSEGDSGGGLVINGTLVGIAQSLFRDLLPFGPSVYTKVTSYLQWIQDNSDVKT